MGGELEDYKFPMLRMLFLHGDLGGGLEDSRFLMPGMALFHGDLERNRRIKIPSTRSTVIPWEFGQGMGGFDMPNTSNAVIPGFLWEFRRGTAGFEIPKASYTVVPWGFGQGVKGF